MNTAPANSDESQLSESRIPEIHDRIKAIVQKVLRKESGDFPDISDEDMIEYMVHTAKKVTSPEAKNFEETLRSVRYKNREINIDNNFDSYLPLASHYWYYICGKARNWILRDKVKSGISVTGEKFSQDIIDCTYFVVKELCDPRKNASWEKIPDGVFEEEKLYKFNTHPYYILFEYNSSDLSYSYKNVYACVVFMIFCKMLDLGYTRTSLSA